MTMIYYKLNFLMLLGIFLILIGNYQG